MDPPSPATTPLWSGRWALAMGAALVVLLGAVHEWQVRGTHEESNLWTLGAVDGRDLVVQVFHGACDEFDAFDAAETPSEVTLAARYQVSNGACNAIGLLECRRVTLSEPLGTRRLLHGRTDAGDAAAPAPDPGAAAGVAGYCAGRV